MSGGFSRTSSSESVNRRAVMSGMAPTDNTFARAPSNDAPKVQFRVFQIFHLSHYFTLTRGQQDNKPLFSREAHPRALLLS